MTAIASTTSTVIILTTLPAGHDGSAVARQLVDARLAACVNVLAPMQSIYRWQETVQEDPERQLVIKTRTECIEPLHAHLRALHPYDVPEFLVLPVTAGAQSYLDWVLQSVDA